MQFKSENYFQPWIYIVSHSQMIIRNQTYPSVRGETDPICDTIDIEFWGIDYINIPTSFRGIDIQIESNPSTLLQDYKKKWGGVKIFKIISEKQIYHIIAAGCVVGKSHWVNEDRLSNFSLKYDEVLMKF
ncbi:MAG: hypothetical protein RLZZ628_245 [Bacteroidota bacterium]